MVRGVLDICAALAAAGHDVKFFTSDAPDIPAEWVSQAIGVPRAKTIPLPSMIGSISPEVESALGTADVLHLHTPWEPANVALARAARRHRVPYVVSTHGMLDNWSIRQKWLKKRLYLRLIGHRFLAGAARVHCTAEAELAQASRFLRPGSGSVVPLPIDLAPFMDLPGPQEAIRTFALDPAQPRILLLSRLHPVKRPELLIEAAAKLAATHPCQLIIAGPGETAYVSSLRQLVHRFGLEERVIFPGMVRGTTKISLYQAANVFVLPSSQENFGLVLIEALVAGTPVITTRAVGIWEELQRAGATIIEPTADHLAKAIQSVLSDPSQARQLGERGRQWVLREFSPQRVAGLYEQMYRSAAP